MEHTGSYISDEEVALRVQNGQTFLFGHLMERYDSKLMRYGRRFLSDKENIEDIVQDVFVSAFQNIQSFNPSLKFSSWIYRIAHNAFVNAMKKKRPITLPDFDFDILVSHQTYEDPAIREKEHEEMKGLIEKGIEELPPKYKEAIILHYLEELSYKEISDVLMIPVGTVGIRIKRGREALRKIYEKMDIHTLEQHGN